MDNLKRIHLRVISQLLRRAQETNLAHELLRTLGGPPQMEETKTVSPGPSSFLVLSPGTA